MSSGGGDVNFLDSWACWVREVNSCVASDYAWLSRERAVLRRKLKWGIEVPLFGGGRMNGDCETRLDAATLMPGCVSSWHRSRERKSK